MANLAIFIISSLPFVLVIAVIAIIILVIVKLCIKKAKKKSSTAQNFNQAPIQNSDQDFNQDKN